MSFGFFSRQLVVILTAAWFAAGGCKPSRSDVFIEIVHPGLVKQLAEKADTIINILPDSAMQLVQPFWVRGEKLVQLSDQKTSLLWYDEQGRLTGMVEYIEEKMSDSIAFYPNGQRMFSLIINNKGKPEGPARYYYPDGRVKLDGRFNNGIQTGIWREFAPDGRLIIAHEYDRYGNQKR